MTYEDIQTKIREVHARTNRLIAQTEEMSQNLKTNIQPIAVLKNAYDELLQVDFLKNGMRSESEEKNTMTSLLKILHYEYHAFFAAADGLAISLRQQITSELSGFSNECIRQAVPDYPKLKNRILEISAEIASISRQQSYDEAMIDTKHYENSLKELMCIYKKVIDSMPELLQVRGEIKRANRWQWIRTICGPIVGATIGYLLAKLF